MNDQDWKISVEKKLTSIKKDIEYIKLFFHDEHCTQKHKTLKSHITLNRVLICGLFTGLLAITTVYITRI